MESAAEQSFHVAINAHLLSSQVGYRSAGVHQYICHLLAHLRETEDGLRYSVLLGKNVELPRGAPEPCRSRWTIERVTARVMWEQFIQPRALRRIGADLAHGPVFVGPLLSTCPFIVTIHDLSFIRFPGLFRPGNRLYLKVMTRLSARRARRLIAVSKHSAAEAVELLNVSQDQVDVVYHGVDSCFHPLPSEAVKEFRRARGLPERLILSVGTLEPRKNLVRLIEAYNRIRDGRTALVLAGGKGWFYQELFAKVEELGLGGSVIMPGFVAGAELPFWYNAATVVAYPSLYEGFGMPVLEAQACGTPVLCADTSSIPEAAGDAAVMIDPKDVGAIASGLNRLLAGSTLRRDLRERGLINAGRFTWSATARNTARVYTRALTEGCTP